MTLIRLDDLKQWRAKRIQAGCCSFDDMQALGAFIDQVEKIDIVRCKDCKWCLIEDGGCERIGMVLFADETENHFCGYGKRKTNEQMD